MNGGAGPPQTQRRHRRAGIETRVDLEFRGVTSFVSGMSEDISPGGLFVRLDDPPPEGTRLRFGFRLEPDTPVVRGLGEVVWVRTEDGGPDQPAGVAIRYVELGDDDRARIATASRRGDAGVVARGGSADERDDTVAVPSATGPDADAGDGCPALGDAAVEHATEPTPGSRSGLPFPWPLMAGMVAVVVLVVSVGALVLGPAGGRRPAVGAAAAVPSPSPTRRTIREATRLEAIRVSESLGSTRVEVLLDGLVTADRFATEAQVHPPRFVLRLYGIAPGGAGDLLEVGASDVRRVRVVERPHDGTLDVVLDLAVATVRVGVRSEGNQVVLETR